MVIRSNIAAPSGTPDAISGSRHIKKLYYLTMVYHFVKTIFLQQSIVSRIYQRFPYFRFFNISLLLCRNCRPKTGGLKRLQWSANDNLYKLYWSRKMFGISRMACGFFMHCTVHKMWCNGYLVVMRSINIHTHTLSRYMNIPHSCAQALMEFKMQHLFNAFHLTKMIHAAFFRCLPATENLFCNDLKECE